MATREGDYLKVFDLDNAFLNAEMPAGSPPVYVSLPPAWREVGDRPIRRLLRALYGLPQSPILWYRKYEAGLKKLGWTVSPFEPGMWRKHSTRADAWIKMIVYVDDNVITGPDEAELSAEMGKIMKLFPGREIASVLSKDGFAEWGILGATLSYNRGRFVSRISIGSYIKATQKRFDFPKLSPKRTPKVPIPPHMVEEIEADSEILTDFPYREMVGSLLWISTTCRPDVARPVNLMAKFNDKPVTRGRARVLMCILAYLGSTLDFGISYSEESELKFTEAYGSDEKGGAIKPSPFHLFCDASGYTPTDEGYSIGGFCFTLFGTVVGWKSRRQTIRASSTCEAEYIAIADGVAWAEVWGYLTFFVYSYKSRDLSQGGLPEATLIWTDSMSARDIALSDMNRPKARWLAIRWYVVKDHRMRLKFCSTVKQRADCLTKPPSREGITAILSQYGVCPLSEL